MKKIRVPKQVWWWVPAWADLLLAGIMSVLVLTVVLLHFSSVKQTLQRVLGEKESVSQKLTGVEKELDDLKNEDQRKVNADLKKELEEIQTNYKLAVAVYENLLDLKELTQKTDALDAQLSASLTALGKRDFTKAHELLVDLKTKIAAEIAKVAPSAIPANVVASNVAPGSGFSRQKVNVDGSDYLVDIVAGDLSSTRVVVDTASEGSCSNDCPVLALSDYVARNGAFAGINGSYFCPASYPSCAGKTNSFDTLLMNKNKVYFNSDNNVYSSVPAVIFGGSWIRFVGKSQEWGRDTGIDSMIANQPLLVSGGEVTFGGNDDPKQGSVGNRSFVANKGNVVYIGVVHGVSVAGSARVLKALGMDNALNLDSGGSTALWSGGYKAGPGRAIPNAILFVRK